MVLNVSSTAQGHLRTKKNQKKKKPPGGTANDGDVEVGASAVFVAVSGGVAVQLAVVFLHNVCNSVRDDVHHIPMPKGWFYLHSPDETKPQIS